MYEDDNDFDFIGTLLNALVQKANDLEEVVHKKRNSAKEKNMAIGAMTAYLDTVDTIHEIMDSHFFIESHSKGN
jgi:hypothetical protein